MTKQLRFFFGVILFCALSETAHAQLSANCKPARAQVDLDINNVRATIMNGGDMWWDLAQSQYEVPKGGGARSAFCGALWMGGLDQQGQLHVAAQSYRQTGNDFWPGPLDTVSATTRDSACQQYDQLWRINRADVECFIENRSDPNYVIPDVILNWPAHGNSQWGQSHSLAPFRDVDGDGNYNPLSGDYPAFNYSGQNNCDYDLLGDQATWWVFNDKGNTHGETGGEALGMEIHAMAFAYRSQNDKLNDATLYRYKVINRSTNVYNQFWFAQWIDYDIGDYGDDYVGCDVGRGLGFGYNGDVDDGSSPFPGAGTYGAHPPALGVDFLGGPFAEPGDNIDNDRDFTVDEIEERIQLSNCVDYYSDFTVFGNPENSQHFYHFMQSKWKDGTHMTYGGIGYGGTQNCDYKYPWDSDPFGFGTYGVPQSPWDEISSGNLPGDRRQMNSVGPFSMNPGEVEVITIGIPWARDTNGNNLDAVDRLKEADDYIQTLFDNCFAIPCADQQAPDITFTVSGNLAYFTLMSEGTAWNWDFGDGETSTAKHPSHLYMSPGDYLVCINVTTPCGTLTDCDTVHIADKLAPCGPAIWRIEGQGNGKQDLEFTQETIAEILSQGRSFFPMYQPTHGPVLVSYENYDALQDGEYRIAFDSVGNSAHWKMWMIGSTDTVYSDTTIASGEIQRISQWGLGVQMTQVAKVGSGYNPDRNGYLGSSIAFPDPAKQWLDGVKDDDTYWTSENWIRSGTMTGTGTCVADFNDRFQGATTLDRNEDFENVLNGTWGPYRLGAYNPNPNQFNICYELGPAWQPSPVSATIINKMENLANVDVVITSDKSKWTRCPVIETGPQWALNENDREAFHLRAGRSVDKEGRTVLNGGTSDQNDTNAADFVGAYGMGWFPGYAINLETGERLNMAFGENSAFIGENGRDMLWNPTENEHTQFAGPLWGGCHYIYVFGHNGNATFTTPAYLAGELKDVPMYDAGKAIYTILASDSTANGELREVYGDAMWMSIPVLASGHSLFECDVTIKLRVQKPYAKYNTSAIPLNNDYPLYGFRVDKDDVGCNLYEHETRVFPNPFHDECIIQFSNPDYHKADLKLYDMRGRLVRVYEDYTTDRIVISGIGLEEGVYNWTLEVEGEKPESGKIILR